MARENRLFLGNVGTGKSTLIKCLLAGEQLDAGIHWVTPSIQSYTRIDRDEVVYTDTPGLANDTVVSQLAADAITTALQLGGIYKLFFLVRIRNGRVVSEDLVTLERVLDSITVESLEVKYTVVMNCVDLRQYCALLERGNSFQKLKTLVNRKYLTDSFCFVPRMRALEDKDATVDLSQAFRDSLDAAPAICIEATQVRRMDLTGFMQRTQAISHELERLQNNPVELLMVMKEQDQALRFAQARHTAQLKRVHRNDAARKVSEDASSSPLAAYVAVTVASEITPHAWYSRHSVLVSFAAVAIILTLFVYVMTVLSTM